MIITPARFEDEMRKIVRSNTTQAQQVLDAVDLMLETLDSLGYARGIALFKEEGNDHYQESSTEQ